MKTETKSTLFGGMKFGLCVLPFALAGGFFTVNYQVAQLPEMAEAVLEQGIPLWVVFAVSVLQIGIISFVLGTAGYFFCKRTGLAKPFGIESKTLLRLLPWIVGFGILFVCDYPVFGRLIPEVGASYEVKISFSYFMSSLLYGGVVEEVMMRWFVMALVVWIYAVATKKEASDIPVWVFVAANILAAMLFAAGHLPATIQLFGKLSFLIVLRCFLMNGAFGIFFGVVFKKYGIQYAMIAHAGLHFVSKVILLILQ